MRTVGVCLAAGIFGTMIALSAAISGCSTEAAETFDPAALEATWNLSSYRSADGELVDADTTFDSHLTLEDGESSGLGGVNTFRGSYEASDDGSISFGPQAATLMAGPPLAMEQEDAFFRALENASAFRVNDDVLTLENADGEVVATFVLSEAVE